MSFHLKHIPYDKKISPIEVKAFTCFNMPVSYGCEWFCCSDNFSLKILENKKRSTMHVVDKELNRHQNLNRKSTTKHIQDNTSALNSKKIIEFRIGQTILHQVMLTWFHLQIIFAYVILFFLCCPKLKRPRDSSNAIVNAQNFKYLTSYHPSPRIKQSLRYSN